MSSRSAAITVHRSREEVERLWREAHPDGSADVTFKDAPGDRGTEIHVTVKPRLPGGRVGELVETVVSAAPLAKAKDDLRRFKQRIETGEVPRSDSSPEGERFERKFRQRPAQPLRPEELEKVGL